MDTNTNLNATSLAGSASNASCLGDVTTRVDRVNLFASFFLLSLSLFFNGLQIVIFSASTLRRFAFATFLIVSATSDFLSLLTSLPRDWLSLVYVFFNVDPSTTFYNSDLVACRTLTYISYVTRFTSAWNVVALTLERLIVSKDPYRKSLLRRSGTAYKQVLSIVVTSFAINCHVLFTWNIVEEHTCSLKLNSSELENLLIMVTYASIILLPLFVTAVLTFLTIQNLNKPIWKVKPRELKKRIIAKIRMERKATYMILSVSITYCVLTLPYSVSWLVLLGKYFVAKNVTSCEFERDVIANDVCELVAMLNFVVKFLMCLIFGNGVVHKTRK